MELRLEREGSRCLAIVAGAMDIYAAAVFRDRMAVLLREYAEVELRLSEVTELDSACLQVLLAAKREAAVEGRVLCLTGHSLPVLEVLELCRLIAHFGDPVIMAGQVAAYGD